MTLESPIVQMITDVKYDSLSTLITHRLELVGMTDVVTSGDGVLDVGVNPGVEQARHRVAGEAVDQHQVVHDDASCTKRG